VPWPTVVGAVASARLKLQVLTLEKNEVQALPEEPIALTA
jgi:hypothetical protein